MPRSSRSSFGDCFLWTSLSAILFLAFLFASSCQNFRFHWTLWSLTLGAIYICMRPIIFPKSLSNVEVLRRAEEDKFSVGNCLAHAFYDNFLEIVLPGFRDRVEDCEKRFNDIDDNFEPNNSPHAAKRRVGIFKKLIVLIPTSGRVAKLMTDADSRVKTFSKLDPVTKAIAGQPSREYVNTVYLVEGTDIHCVCEFATPLVSLHQMWEVCATPDKQMLQRQIHVFASRLKELLSNHKLDTRDACELVVYRDEQAVSVSDVLIKTVRRLQRQERDARSSHWSRTEGLEFVDNRTSMDTALRSKNVDEQHATIASTVSDFQPI